MSLWPEPTLRLTCNTCPHGILPSLKEFERTVHKVICFDEVLTDQVLVNRNFVPGRAMEGFSSGGRTVGNMNTVSGHTGQINLPTEPSTNAHDSLDEVIKAGKYEQLTLDTLAQVEVKLRKLWITNVVHKAIKNPI